MAGELARIEGAEAGALDPQAAGVSALVLATLAQYGEDARGAFAPNTERAVKADTAIFTRWCAGQDLAGLPASAATVAAFVRAMAECRAPATVRRYIASVAHLHRAARLANPCGEEAVRLALKAMHKSKGRVQAQAHPLVRPVVERMLQATRPATPRALRNRAVLAVAYDTLCRRSEIVALEVRDLAAGEGGAGSVAIRRSKTDQEGMGAVRYLAADTWRHITAWLAAAEIRDGPLFRSVGKAGAIGRALDAGDVGRIFKEMAAAAGVAAEEVARISGHSSRVGAAIDMVASERIELPAIMQAGGWKTPEMVSRYTQKLEAKRSGSAKLAVLQNRE